MNKTIIIICFFVVFFIALLCGVFVKNGMLISVVMPVHNTEKYLDENIKSVLAQTYKNFEFIIIDDGSTDNSLKIIQKYATKDERIKLFALPQKVGAGKARNEGIKHINGKYTLFIDSDDWLDVATLEKSYKYAIKHDLDMVLFLATIFDEKNQQYQQDLNVDRRVTFDYRFLENKGMKIFSYKDIPNEFFNFSKKTPWNKLIRTSIIKEHNLYFDDVPHHNDTFFITMAMVYAKRIGYIKDRLYFYRTNRADSISESGDTDARSVEKTFEKIKHELETIGVYNELKVSFNSWVLGWLGFMHKVAKSDPSQQRYYKETRELIE